MGDIDRIQRIVPPPRVEPGVQKPDTVRDQRHHHPHQEADVVELHPEQAGEEPVESPQASLPGDEPPHLDIAV